MKCSKNSCEKKYTDLAKEEGIFFYTKMTCAGDEIGWDFIRCVKSSKISFTGFCRQMTNFYRTTHSNPQPFMAVKTFIGWFFGWLSAFKIDFHKEIDPFCGYNPRVLACDGTHIGVSLRHLKLHKPVTKPQELGIMHKYNCQIADLFIASDKTDVSPWVHDKPERHMFHRKQDKDHVKYMCRKIGHICGINFKSTKVEGLDGVNSEICEQVNSYLQCIKYTGSHLSQEHFVFFLQFFLYLLNKEKTERQREMAKIALAGHQ